VARETEQVYPRFKLNIALGFMASLLLGIGLAFLLEFMDRTLKNAEDVNAAVAAPFLGVIPVVDEVSRQPTEESVRERDLYVFRHPTSRAGVPVDTNQHPVQLGRPADEDGHHLEPAPARGQDHLDHLHGLDHRAGRPAGPLVDTDLRRRALHKSLGVRARPDSPTSS
jgi:hypothetical protein